MFKPLLLVTIITTLASCSKVNVQPAASINFSPPSAAPPEAPVVFVQQQRPQTAQERLVEIDRRLSEPLTGTQADADMRVTLRAERDALAGKARMSSVQNPVPLVDSRNHRLQAPAVTVAGDSRVAERASYERQQLAHSEARSKAIERTNDNQLIHR